MAFHRLVCELLVSNRDKEGTLCLFRGGNCLAEERFIATL